MRVCGAGMLDVQQVFGRAGRPQFQDTGEGIIITTHDKLAHYLGMLTHQVRARVCGVRGARSGALHCAAHGVRRLLGTLLRRRCHPRRLRLGAQHCIPRPSSSASCRSALAGKSLSAAPTPLPLAASQVPIESQFIAGLVDHLNAEIVLGTVNLEPSVVFTSYAPLGAALAPPASYCLRLIRSARLVSCLASAAGLPSLSCLQTGASPCRDSSGPSTPTRPC